MAITTPKTRTYYGEYTLKHWIDLILSGNIVLPKYQRSFAWTEDKIEQFIESLKVGDYIPPIAIAAGQEEGKDVNLILDGQQRLTSVLLASLGYMPKSKNFPMKTISFDESESDEESEEEKAVDQVTTISWSVRVMLDDTGHRNRGGLKSILSRDSRYEPRAFLDEESVEDFLENTPLGFLYIVPVDTSADSQRLFAKLFRSINYYGIRLSGQESRKALYYQDQTMVDYFEGYLEDKVDVLCGLSMPDSEGGRQKVDWMRYLSILSQQHIDKRPLRGYARQNSREDFYEDYVAYILGLNQKNMVDKFGDFKGREPYKDLQWKERYKALHEQLLGLIDKIGTFSSVIDADYWLFGLIHFVLFKGKTLREGCGDDLKRELEKKVSEAKDDYFHKKDPAQLKFLRERLDGSIGIYSKYVS